MGSSVLFCYDFKIFPNILHFNSSRSIRYRFKAISNHHKILHYAFLNTFYKIAVLLIGYENLGLFRNGVQFENMTEITPSRNVPALVMRDQLYQKRYQDDTGPWTVG